MTETEKQELRVGERGFRLEDCQNCNGMGIEPDNERPCSSCGGDCFVKVLVKTMEEKR